MMKCLENLKLKRRKEKKRLQNVIDDSSNNKKIFLYTTGPLDHWDGGWGRISCHAYKCYHSERIAGVQYGDTTAEEKVYHMERLLMEGLIYFSKYFKDNLRGEPIHYIEVYLKEEEFGECAYFTAIAIKCDTNGTCYCFSYSPKIAQSLPHDYGDEWELYDASFVR